MGYSRIQRGHRMVKVPHALMVELGLHTYSLPATQLILGASVSSSSSQRCVTPFALTEWITSSGQLKGQASWWSISSSPLSNFSLGDQIKPLVVVVSGALHRLNAFLSDSGERRHHALCPMKTGKLERLFKTVLWGVGCRYKSLQQE